MREEVIKMFAATNLLTYPEQDFALVKLHPSDYKKLLALLSERHDSGYQTILRAHDEVTLVATAEFWQELAGELEAVDLDQPWHLITLDVTIPLDVFGYMEEVARICARCEASMVVESGYSTDHLLIKADRYRDVLESLHDLILRCRQGVSST